MSITVFLAAVIGLLFAPGPTNTLMGLAGAQGFRQLPRLIPAEVLGYLTAVVPLAWLGDGMIAHWPELALVLRLAAIAWVVFLAIRLWNFRDRPGRPLAVTGWKVYFTTLLNPKATVVALVLLPGFGAVDFAPRLVLFACAVVAMALVWGLAGSLTMVRDRGRLQLIQRVASVWLGIASAAMAAGLLSGVSGTL